MAELAIIRSLMKLQEQGILSAIDVEFCRFLQDVEPEVDDAVLLAACLVSRAYREGNVCIVLDEYAGSERFKEIADSMHGTMPDSANWKQILSSSTVVGRDGDYKPLILDDTNRLYLQRHWQNEQDLVRLITDKANAGHRPVDPDQLNESLNRLFTENKGEVDWQKVAAAAAIFNRFTVISGGPGTGKTTTVVRLLALLYEQGEAMGKLPSVALAAPTGKAAARLEASIREGLNTIPIEETIKEQIPVECRTIHQLLGARLHSAQFRFNEENPLPYDYIILDEVSMVDQAMMSRLMKATLKKTSVLFLGDKDQLASVEAGSVLGDICGDHQENHFSGALKDQFKTLGITIPADAITSTPRTLTDNIVLLQKSYRFDERSGIGRLAAAINRGDTEESMNVLNNSSIPDAAIIQEDSYASYLEEILDSSTSVFVSVAKADSPEEMLAAFSQFQILSPHRRGPWGIEYLNRQIEDELEHQNLKPPYENWYKGKPVIINENSYSLGLSNGDMGVCVPDEQGNAKIYFDADDGLIEVWPSQLPDYSTAFVLTVHKSQGSEFDNVMLVLPAKKSKVLSRELLYTAVTRARNSVNILGDAEVFRESVHHKVARNSGLNDHLWNK